MNCFRRGAKTRERGPAFTKAGPLSLLLSISLQVVFLDPADAAPQQAKRLTDYGGQQEANEQKPDPLKRARLLGTVTAKPAEYHTNGPKQAAGTHTRIDGSTVHFNLEQASGKRTRDGRSNGGGQPDAGIFHDVGHLQHTCAKPL